MPKITENSSDLDIVVAALKLHGFGQVAVAIERLADERAWAEEILARELNQVLADDMFDPG